MPQVKQRPRVARTGWQAALCWLAPLALFGLVQLVFGMRYTTNDDAILANIAAGAYGPDRVHLVYVNILFGWLLRPLYALADGVNWYVLVQLLLVWVACAMLLRLAQQRYGLPAGMGLFWAVGLPFAVHILYLFQYNKNSALCTAAGLILVAATLGAPDRRTAVGILLALFGSLLRWQMFCAVGGLGAALLLGRFFALEKEGRRKAIATMALLLGLAFAAKGVDVLAYRLDDGWRAYSEYNSARMAYSDYKAYFTPEENIFAEAGLSDNDYTMLQGWNFYDGDFFGADKLRALAAQVPAKPLLQTLKDALKAGFHLLYGRSYRYVFTALLLGALLLLRPNVRCLPFWGTMALLGLEVLYLSARERMPHYIEIPLLLAACLLGLAALGIGDRRHAAATDPGAPPTLRWRRGLRALSGGRLLAGACLLLTLASLPTLAETYHASRHYRDWDRQEQARFEEMSRDKAHLYLLSTHATDMVSGWDIWRPREKDFFSNIVVYGGWLSHAPHREQALAAYGLRCPLTDGVDQPQVFFGYAQVEDVARYASEHLGQTVVAVATGPNPNANYQLVTQTEGPA